MTNVYSFKEGFSDKSQLGNKGANLVTMWKLGLPVPLGFVLTIDAYWMWQKTKILPVQEIKKELYALERETGKKLGAGMEVSVRSSAPISMPGMMDTVLNISDYKQIEDAIQRIFKSWDNDRAKEYRKLNNIPGILAPLL